MGYLGFGLDKEIYTRKPKDAFGKIKKYGNDLANERPEKEASLKAYEEIMSAHRSRLKRNPWRIFLNLALFLGILAFITFELYYLLSHLAIIFVPFIF